MRSSNLVLAFLVVFPLLSSLRGASPADVAKVKPAVQEISQPPLTTQKGQVKCGQTLYLLAAPLAPSNGDITAKTPLIKTANYPVAIPECDSENGPGDFVLRIKGGALTLVAVEKPSFELLPFLTSGKTILVLVVLLIVSLAFLYAAYEWILLPNLRTLLTAQMKHQVSSAPSSAAAMAASRSNSQQANSSAAAIDVARQITDFRTGEFLRLADRVERLENEQRARSSQTAPPRIVKHQVAEFTPPIVTTVERTPYEQFIDAVNQARIDPAAREQFLRRYKPKALEVANSVEVTRSKERPVFTLREGGNLLAIPTRNVEEDAAWPEGHFYLVPSFELRWTNERINGGSWDHFFDVKSVNGVTALVQAATVKQEGSSWEIADDQSRGEITWDPNVAAT